MPFLTPQQRSFLTAVSQLVYANPFLPERVEFERAALGDAFVAGEPVWSQHVRDPEQPRAARAGRPRGAPPPPPPRRPPPPAGARGRGGGGGGAARPGGGGGGGNTP